MKLVIFSQNKTIKKIIIAGIMYLIIIKLSYYGVSDFNIWIRDGLMLSFLIICIVIVTTLLKKGYNIKT